MNTLKFKNFTVKCRKEKGLRIAILASAVMLAIGCTDQDTANNRQGLTEDDATRSVQQQEREDQERARGMFDDSSDHQTSPGMRTPGDTTAATQDELGRSTQERERDQMQQQQGEANQ